MLKQITVLDSTLSLLYALIILLIINVTKPSKSLSSTTFFIPFFSLKIIFALLFVLIHCYYYRGGDTFLYFAGGELFIEQIKNNPTNIFSILFSSHAELINLPYSDNYSVINYIKSPDVLFMSIILLITGNNYLTASIIYTVITAIGIWKLYITMCKLYPSLYKLFALGILFYPSLGIWGSGILKDPLTLCSIGFIFHATYSLINAKKIINPIFLILISIYVCFILKPYILYVFVPIILLWSQSQLSNKLKKPFFKFTITPMILILFGFGGFYAINSISTGAGKYSLDSVRSVAEGFQSWHTYLAETRDQSGYNLGEVNFTPLGVFKKAPEAFFVAYFRPFLIVDTRNIATLFEAIQNFVLLTITIYIIAKVGILKSFKLIFLNNNLRAFMLFAVIFGITVGITSYNFGALSRYKIPSLPFFTASLAILYKIGYLDKKKHSNKQYK